MQLLKINSFTALDINGKLQILATPMLVGWLGFNGTFNTE